MLPTGDGSVGIVRQPRTTRSSAAAACSIWLRAVRASCGVGRQEPDAGGVGPRGRQLEACYFAVEAIGNLDQDAGAVAGVDLGAGRAPVLEVAQAVEAHADDLMAAPAVHVHDESHPARVVLELGAIEAYRRGCGIHARPSGGRVRADPRKGTPLALAAPQDR